MPLSTQGVALGYVIIGLSARADWVLTHSLLRLAFSPLYKVTYYIPILYFWHSLLSYICIPDAQYYELSAWQNLWCEILEFWVVWANTFAHSMLRDFLTKCYEIRLAKEPFFNAIEPLLHSNTVAVGTQKSLFCAPIAALSECKRGFFVWRRFCLCNGTP